MSRSELAQSIDESTQGKVTHRQGDFNRKLGNKGRSKWQIKTLITLAYSREGEPDHSPQDVSWKPGCPFMPQPGHLD